MAAGSTRNASIIIICVATLSSGAKAEDTVYLRGGQQVKGKVIDRGSTIVVEHKHGSIAFDAAVSDIELAASCYSAIAQRTLG